MFTIPGGSVMRRVLIAFAALIATLASGASALPASAANSNAGGPYEVQVVPGVSPVEHATSLLQRLGISAEERPDRLGHVYHHLLPGYSLELTPGEARKAERFTRDDDEVVSFGLSLEMSTGPVAFSGVAAEGQVESLALTRHGMPEQLDTGVTSVIAILDTGVDPNHPDLNVTLSFNATAPGTEVVDVAGHGTYVASLAAAIDNDIGIRGADPGAEILNAKVLGDSGRGWTADIAAALDWVGGLVLSGHRVDVINMSFGGPGPRSQCGGFDVVHNMICELDKLNVVSVTSAGNSSSDVADFLPASYPETVSVSAIADADGRPGGLALMPEARCAAGSVDDGFATFSNFGEGVDITAVGVCNIGLVPTNYDHPLLGGYSMVASGSGTSYSGPLVAGAIARYRAANPDQPAQVAVDQVLRYSAMFGGSYTGDPDGVYEPVLWLGEIPRLEG